MKTVALDSSSHGPFEDARARFKYQTLMQDYQELHKEVQATRSKLEAMKQRKLTLLAETRFLRHRYKHLLKNKAAPPQKRGTFLQKNIGTGKTYYIKEAKVRNAATAYNLNQKERFFTAKESVHRNSSPIFNLNPKVRTHVGKEAFPRNTTPVFDLNQSIIHNPFLNLNQKERLVSGKETTSRSPARAIDINLMEKSYLGREYAVQNHAPTFDLNRISEEEELQENNEPLRMEEPKKFLIRTGTDEQLNDLKLSTCRNGPNPGGKRKISWQDPVVLQV
ncbi:hypothetical protein NMG60_11013070 [Bertholletia excelsa]